MKIFNTLTRRKEEFVPLEPGKVKIIDIYFAVIIILLRR